MKNLTATKKSMMRTIWLGVALCGIGQFSHAQNSASPPDVPQPNALAQCLSDNTTGAERKSFAKWIFVAMAAHPELNRLTVVSKQEQEKIDRTMGQLVTELLTERCVDEVRAIREIDRQNGFELAFKYLGEIAMQELINNPQFKTRANGFTPYLDVKKIKTAFQSAP